MGNFGVVKRFHMHEGVKMGKLYYIGNANVGANTNIGGAGHTITAHYDGSKKIQRNGGEDVSSDRINAVAP